jgi:hypothetical protein
MSYLFIKNLFQREQFVFFHKKLKIKKKTKRTQKTHFWGFLGGYFGWVFNCQPCLHVDAVPAVVGRVALFQLGEHAAEVGQIGRPG